MTTDQDRARPTAGPSVPTDRDGRLPVAVRHPARVLLGVLALLVLAVPLAAGAQERLVLGGVDDPAAESTRAAALVEQRFPGAVPDLVLLARADDVDTPAAEAAGRTLTARLAAVPGVQAVASYWDAGRPAGLRDADGTAALITASVPGDDSQIRAPVTSVREELAGRVGPLEVQVGGAAAVGVEIDERSESDLVRAELIAAPVVLLVLLLVFRSVVAALLPLLVGALSVLGALVVLRGLTEVTSVSVFSLNITTALGLGLGIDCSLFVVTRFREELARGLSPRQAAAVARRTAGRTVLFSAVTVALSLCGLLVFPQYFLRSFAYGGVAVVACAAAVSTLVLPAVLALLGRRVDALRLPQRRGSSTPAGQRWYRLGAAVVRRPVAAAVAGVVLLLVLGAPFLQFRPGVFDDRVLPRSAEPHQVAEVLRTDFGRPADALSVVVPAGVGDPADRAAVLSALPGVRAVQAPAGTWVDGAQAAPADALSAGLTSPGGGTLLLVVPDSDPVSDAGQRLVDAVRASPGADGTLVGGTAATLSDSRERLQERLPLALAVVVVATGVLLFLFTGGLLVPLKALVLAVLSLSATFGVMVLMFQQGNVTSLVGDPIVTGTLEVTIPVLMFCIAFGLSMDYELFLLSRVKEEYARTGDNTGALLIGLQRTGGIITSAAVLLSIVLLALASSDLQFLKLLGVGLTVAVLMDATLVRGILVPALMHLAGKANWWAPAPLRRLHDRIGLTD